MGRAVHPTLARKLGGPFWKNGGPKKTRAYWPDSNKSRSIWIRVNPIQFAHFFVIIIFNDYIIILSC